MTFRLGSTALPVANVARDAYSQPTEQIGDPALTVLLSWVSAVLTADIGAAWTDLAPGEPLVRTTSPHDPRAEDFDAKRLPQLFAYREDGMAQYAEGEWTEARPITLLWVFPPAPQDRQWARRGIGTAIGRSLLRAVGRWNGRHPSWVVTGDTDTFAATYGSSILTWGGFKTLAMVATRAAEIQIGEQKYDAVSVEMNAAEEVTQTAEDEFELVAITGEIRQTTAAGEIGFTQGITTASPPMSSFSGEFNPEEFR